MERVYLSSFLLSAALLLFFSLRAFFFSFSFFFRLERESLRLLDERYACSLDSPEELRVALRFETEWELDFRIRRPRETELSLCAIKTEGGFKGM